MTEFENPYLYHYSPNMAEIIFKYENNFRNKVASGIFVENKVYFLDLINEIKQSYVNESGTESFFNFQLEDIINSFAKRNKDYLLDNFCNDLSGIIPITKEEFDSVPTREDLELLKNNLINNESEEKNKNNSELTDDDEYTLIDQIFAILNGIKRFVNKENINYKNLIIYILRFSNLRKKLIKELDQDPQGKELIIELGLDKLNDKYISDQILRSIELDSDIELIIKNNTHYSLKYFRNNL